MMDKYLVVIAGPTASGKTATAIKVAKALGTVIISADRETLSNSYRLVSGEDYKLNLIAKDKIIYKEKDKEAAYIYYLMNKGYSYAEKIIKSDDSIEYKFRTRTLGADTCRSTKGCFEDLYIDQDMQMVIDTINKFELGE